MFEDDTMRFEERNDDMFDSSWFFIYLINFLLFNLLSSMGR